MLSEQVESPNKTYLFHLCALRLCFHGRDGALALTWKVLETTGELGLASMVGSGAGWWSQVTYVLIENRFEAAAHP